MSLHYRWGLLLLFLFPTAVFSQDTNYDPSRLFAVSDLQKDFQFVRAKLEKTDPNIYLYTAKKRFDIFFDSLCASITRPLTAMEFYNLVCLLNSKIMDGHTMFLPGEEASGYFNRIGRFFPFYLAIIDGKIYVSMNCSGDTAIKEGAEILSINHLSTPFILKQLLMRQIHDGHNQTYPRWILTNYFKEYFSFSFGHPDSFLIAFKSENHVQQTTIVPALSKDSIASYRQRKYPARPSTAPYKKQGILLEMDQEPGVATMVIKSFDRQILQEKYDQVFDSTIEKMFAQIRENHIQNLVLDIRDNQGGDFEPGRLLLSHLLAKPIVFLAKSHEEQKIVPLKNRYSGNLYILINGGSFSNSGIVSSYLALTRRGIFIGEEAGGNKNIIGGDPAEFVLPNTSIIAEVSTVKYVIRQDFNNGHGVQPVYPVASTIENILANKDAAKRFTLDLISHQR